MTGRDHTLPTRPCNGPQCDALIVDMILVRADGERVRHVFDPEPIEGGTYQIAATLLGELEARHDASATRGYVSHFASCPNAPQFR